MTVHKTDAEWRDQLSDTEYRVTREAATERPFTGEYWDHWERGVYNCVCCGTPLFESSTKFDAGCGWPSYFQPINGEVIAEKTDRSHGMLRIEVQCKTAARTWATCSKMAPPRPACGIASTRLR
jgi:peptide-methionine (R)-S-oxide reductase